MDLCYYSMSFKALFLKNVVISAITHICMLCVKNLLVACKAVEFLGSLFQCI